MSNPFWYKDPTILFRKLDILPNDKMKYNEKLNKFSALMAKHNNENEFNFIEENFYNHIRDLIALSISMIQLKSKNDSRLYQEAHIISSKLEVFLQHNLFKEVSRPTTIKLNSPVLQKKAGYREVLKTWLMFDLSAKLIWEGGEDVYAAGGKNIAKLYVTALL